MKLLTLWGTRVGFEDAPPELMVAWDEYCHDNWAEGFDKECEAAIASWGSDLVETRQIVIDVSEPKIRYAFKPQYVAGRVENTDTRSKT